MILRVPGTPVPQGSMRMFKNGGVAHSNETLLLGYRSDIANRWEQMRGIRLTGGVSVLCVFAFPRPARHYHPVTKKRLVRELRADAPLFHTQTPDVDKLLRAVSDSLTGLAYADDAQIVRMSGVKTWDVMGWSRITVLPAEGEDK
jgi:Holliday junction resolvase RusA-like endonuclease